MAGRDVSHLVRHRFRADEGVRLLSTGARLHRTGLADLIEVQIVVLQDGVEVVARHLHDGVFLSETAPVRSAAGQEEEYGDSGEGIVAMRALREFAEMPLDLHEVLALAAASALSARLCRR